MRLIQLLIPFTVAIIFAFPAITSGKTDEIYAKYKYVMGDNDTKNDATRIAFIEAKRRVLEKVGVFVSSDTEVSNFRLTKDQIRSYTAAILQVEVVSEKVKFETETTKPRIRKLSAKADTETTKPMKQELSDESKPPAEIDEAAFAEANADWESKKQEWLVAFAIFGGLSVFASNEAKDTEAEFQKCKNEGGSGFKCLNKQEDADKAETLFRFSLVATIVTAVVYFNTISNPPNRNDFLLSIVPSSPTRLDDGIILTATFRW